MKADTRVRQPYGAKSGTCADCQKTMWRGSTSLPQGEAMCRPCRARRRQDERVAICPACGVTFTAELLSNGSRRRTCSRACRFATARAGRTIMAGELIARPCPDCGVSVVGRHPLKRCSDCRAVRIRLNWYRKNAARRGIYPQATMTIVELGDRDRWRCHLCEEPVDKTRRGNDPLGPTYDHLIPVTDGGDDAPENLRLAHRACNTRRGARGVVQLLLFG